MKGPISDRAWYGHLDLGALTNFAPELEVAADTPCALSHAGQAEVSSTTALEDEF